VAKVRAMVIRVLLDRVNKLCPYFFMVIFGIKTKMRLFNLLSQRSTLTLNNFRVVSPRFLASVLFLPLVLGNVNSHATKF
jgi:hypothetical protein